MSWRNILRGFRLAMLMIMPSLTGCGWHNSVSRPNYNPPPGYRAAKHWVKVNLPKKDVYFRGVLFNVHISAQLAQRLYIESVSKSFTLKLHHHVYPIPRGRWIGIVVHSPQSPGHGAVYLSIPSKTLHWKWIRIDP